MSGYFADHLRKGAKMMTADDEKRHALSFGQAADAYDAIRPTYPAEALNWALGEKPLTIVDLGAGTGILTRALVALGHRVTAIEPDQQMLATLLKRSPGIRDARLGTAEEIPLPDGYADAITAGQSYHWFERDKAHPEMARVLKSGGVFVPVWNVRDESVPWVGRMTELVGRSPAEGSALLFAGNDFGPHFGEPVRHSFRYDRTFTEDSLVDLVKSRSYYLAADDAHRAVLEERIRYMVRTHPDLAGKPAFALPYETIVYRIPRAE